MKRLVLSVIVAFTLFAFVHAAVTETTCQTHQRSSGPTDHGMTGWNVTCHPVTKLYHPSLQCMNRDPTSNSTRLWCACYNDEEAVTTPSMKLKSCECPLATFALRNGRDRKVEGCDYLECEKTGKFKIKQTCDGQYYCVNPDTGAVTKERTTDANVQCPV